jgi:cytochrome c biogenesis protein CcdA
MVVYGALGLCGLVLCGLHLRDAFRYRRTGKASDMEMGLSKETHRGIHDRIKRFTTVKSYLLGPAAVLLGGLVSSMELACTGQVYFPVLAALMKDGVTPRSLGLLLIYNLCFLVPLVVITVLAAYGVGAKALGEWARRNVFSTKVLMAGLFAVLGLVMIVMSVMSFM